MHPDATRRTSPVAPPPADTHATPNTRPDLADLPDLSPPPGFELLEVVGRGGMGVVVRAREVAFDREVAVKFLLGETPNPALVVRFMDEARITGQLQHPGIPAAYRTGLLPDGRPYLAMKLIRGRTLAELLANDLASGPRERAVSAPEQGADTPRSPGKWLGVFEGVCQAVGYAHAHGVIHRDLKPGNVMVGSFGEVQVMDWGLAKLTASRERERPENQAPVAHAPGSPIRPLRNADDRTQTGSVLGTPAYMPPEQARGEVEAVTERSDVFGLGAVLCVVLTGRPPFDGPDSQSTLFRAMAGDTAEAFERLDRCGAEAELIALCKRCLSVDPADRPADGAAVATAVAGLRAAADDRARRAEVAAASQRARRRVVQWAGGLLVAVLAAGMAGTGAGYLNAEESRRHAVHARGKEKERADAEAEARKEAEAAKKLAEERRAEAEKATKLATLESEWARTTLDFLVNDLIRQTNSYYQARSGEAEVNPHLTLREAIDRAAGKIDARTRDRPHIAPALRGPIGEAYTAVGEHAKAITTLEKTLAESLKYRGADDGYTLYAKRCLAEAYLGGSKFDKAQPLFEELAKHRTAALGEGHRDTLFAAMQLAGCLRERGNPAAGLKVIAPAGQKVREKYGADDPLTLAVTGEWAACELAAGKHERAVELAEWVLRQQRRTQGDAHPDTLTAAAWLGWCHMVGRTPHLAVPLFEEALKGRRKALGNDHLHTLLSTDNLGNAYLGVGRADEAVPLLEEALKGRRALLGPDNVKTFWSMGNLAGAYTRVGRLAEARELYVAGAKRQGELFGADFPNRLVHLTNLAECELLLGQPRRALLVVTEAQAGWVKRFSPDHPNVFICQGAIAQCHLDLCQADKAVEQAAAAADGLAKKFGDGSATALEARLLQAECELAAGRPADAAKRLTAQLALLRKGGPNGGPLPKLLATAGRLLLACGEVKAAEPVLREAVAAMEKGQPAGWETARARSLHGAAMAGLKQYADAEPLLLGGVEGLAKAGKQLPPREVNERREAAVRVVELYAAWGKPEKAAEWRAKVPAETLPMPRGE